MKKNSRKRSISIPLIPMLIIIGIVVAVIFSITKSNNFIHEGKIFENKNQYSKSNVELEWTIDNAGHISGPGSSKIKVGDTITGRVEFENVTESYSCNFRSTSQNGEVISLIQRDDTTFVAEGIDEGEATIILEGEVDGTSFYRETLIHVEQNSTIEASDLETVQVEAHDGRGNSYLQMSLAQALENNANDGRWDGIKLIGDITLENELEIASNNSLTIDLNGYTLNSNATTYAMKVKGYLTIKDSSSRQTGAIVANNGSGITFNFGTIAIEGGRISATGDRGLSLTGSVTATITGGTITGKTGVSVSGVVNTLLTISDGEIIGTDEYGLNSTNNVTINFNGGMIKGKKAAIYNTEVVIVPSEYKLNQTTTPDNQGYYLATLVELEASITKNEETTEYATIEEALSNATNGDTVKLLKDVVRDDTISYTPGNPNTNVTLDLNSKKIQNTAGEKYVLQLAGGVRIDDSSAEKTGSIEGAKGIYAKTGTITLQSGTINANTGTGIVLGTSQYDGCAKTVINRRKCCRYSIWN